MSANPDDPGSAGHANDLLPSDEGAGEAAFTRALRAAISARGVSLETLRQELLERGSKVSVATLSYWRTGRSRPDRGGSMVALAQLEEVLGLPAGFLTSKVNPRGPGREAASELRTHYRMADRPSVPGTGAPSDADVVRAGLAEVGMTWDDGLTRVSYHDRLEIRADRTDGAHDVRTVFIAARGGVERFPIWYTHDDEKAFPFVIGLSNCRLGRVVEFREKAAVAAEMILEHPLEKGESAIVEHRLESIGQTIPTMNLFRRVSGPIRELVMEVRFPPTQIPRQAWIKRVVAGEETVTPALVTGGSLHLLRIDPAPGVYGLEWDW